MSARCQLTGAKPGFGKKVSHSHRRTSRRFDPNIQTKRYWLPRHGRYVRLRAVRPRHQDHRQDRYRGRRGPHPRPGEKV